MKPRGFKHPHRNLCQESLLQETWEEEQATSNLQKLQGPTTQFRPSLTEVLQQKRTNNPQPNQFQKALLQETTVELQATTNLPRIHGPTTQMQLLPGIPPKPRYFTKADPSPPMLHKRAKEVLATSSLPNSHGQTTQLQLPLRKLPKLHTGPWEDIVLAFLLHQAVPREGHSKQNRPYAAMSFWLQSFLGETSNI